VINGQLVSGDFFRTMGLKAAAGRLFDAADDKPSAAPVAVLNYGYWQSAFGGARDVVGRTIELNDVPFTIIGIAEQRFTGVTPGSDYDVWLPLSDAQRITELARWQNRSGDVSNWWLTIIGRLKPETQVAQAQAVVSGLFRNEVIHGSVPLFHGGEMGLRPGAPAARGTVSNQMFHGPMAPTAGGNTPAGIPAPLQRAPGGPVQVRRDEASGPIPASASHTPVMAPAPPAADGGPKTLSTEVDDPHVTLVPAPAASIPIRFTS
jgi:hypothetical protein